MPMGDSVAGVKSSSGEAPKESLQTPCKHGAQRLSTATINVTLSIVIHPIWAKAT
jgi:hypothetical protein